MQDQGRRLMLAVALALGVMLLWNMVFSPKDANPPPGQGSGSEVKGSAGSAAPAALATLMTSKVGCPHPETPVVKRGPEHETTLSFPNVVATFTSWGGDLKTWQLTDPRYQHDTTKGDLLPRMADAAAFDVNFSCDSSYVLPKHAEWKLVSQTATQVVYSLATPDLEVVKTFDVVPEDDIVKLTVRVTAHPGDDKAAHETLAITAYQLQDPKAESGGSSRIQPRVWQSSTLRDGTIYSTDIGDLLKGGARFEPTLTWTGFEHPYLLDGFAVNPAFGPTTKSTYADASGLMRTDIETALPVLDRKTASVERTIVGYLGPKSYDKLDKADSVAGFSTGFKEVIDFGWFGFIGRPLLWLLLKFQAVVGNWGIAIILLTFLVKAATLYWTTKSMRSMKAMAVLGPQMKALQEKYKDDKQRLQLETMALYKQHGVNPLAGCLPMLLQMPIWIALYRMLSSAGELYQQPFIRGWIDDLTNSDPTYVLPVVLVVTMFAQARLTPTTVDPSQKMQQRMMQYGMPLMFGAMSFVFPAGLTLYIFTNTCLSAVHSIYINKYDKKSMALTAQLKKNQADAKAAKEAAAVATAKDANPKNDSADAPAAEAKPKARSNQQQRRKKGGRR